MPNTIADNLLRLQTARTAIAGAITAKGGTVTTGDGFEEFPADIATITNQYTAQDEGKVVSNGALVAQGFDTATENGIVDTTLISSLLVNVKGSGASAFKLTLLSSYTNVTANDFYIFEGETHIYCCGYLNGNFSYSYQKVGFSVPQDFDINKIGTEYLSVYNGITSAGPNTNAAVVDKTNRTITFKPGSSNGPRIAMIAFNKASS